MSSLVTDTNLSCCIVKVSVSVYSTNINKHSTWCIDRQLPSWEGSFIQHLFGITDVVLWWVSQRTFFLLEQCIYEPCLTYVPCGALPWRWYRISWPWELYVLCMSFNTGFSRLEAISAAFLIILSFVPSVVLVTFSHRYFFIFFPSSRQLAAVSTTHLH
jgi:hypothetical protein